MKIAARTPLTPQRLRKQAELEKSLEEAWGTYMYCEAADFQSDQERRTSSEMRTRMSELSKELAELRGDSVLDKAHLDNYLDNLTAKHPVAGLGGPVLQKLLPHLWAPSNHLTDDIAEIHDALTYKEIDPEQFQAALAKRAARRKPTRQADDPEVRQQVSQELRQGVPKDGPDLFASVTALAQSVLEAPKSPALSRAIAQMVIDGDLEVSPQDLSKGSWQCVYQKGDLGRWSERLQNEEVPTRRSNLAGRMATMLDHPDLKFPAKERKQALAALTGWLEKRGQQAVQYPASIRSYLADLPRWEKYGIDTEPLANSVSAGQTPGPQEWLQAR